MASPVSQIRSAIGILAYGSLIADPGVEIDPLIVDRIETRTPFPVEYARFSATRGGAPTVVRHSMGRPVKAYVLVLAKAESPSGALRLCEARDLLWHRETRNEGTGKYRESGDKNAVLVRDLPGFCDLAHVLYTDFNPEGKIADPDPKSLARAVIESVGRAPLGKDGISYLIALLKSGVETELTARYVAEIQSQTGTYDLACALRQLKTSKREGMRNSQS